jgi:hypothetical protein
VHFAILFSCSLKKERKKASNTILPLSEKRKKASKHMKMSRGEKANSTKAGNKRT